MQNATNKLSKIFYEIAGSGKNLVLLHGFCEDVRIWNKLKEKLSEHFRLILIDLPGFGKSDVLNVEPSVEEYAEAVYTVLLNEKIKKCLMVGHSLGGYVALAFGEKFSDMLDGICLFHSQPFADDEAKKQSRLKSKKFVQEVSGKKFVEELMSNLFTEEFKSKNVTEVQQITNQFINTNAKGICDALDAMRLRPDRSDLLKSLQHPVLFIIGKKDSVINFETSLKMISLPERSQVCVLNNSAHMGMIEEDNLTYFEIVSWGKSIS